MTSLHRSPGPLPPIISSFQSIPLFFHTLFLDSSPFFVLWMCPTCGSNALEHLMACAAQVAPPFLQIRSNGIQSDSHIIASMPAILGLATMLSDSSQPPIQQYANNSTYGYSQLHVASMQLNRYGVGPPQGRALPPASKRGLRCTTVRPSYIRPTF